MSSDGSSENESPLRALPEQSGRDPRLRYGDLAESMRSKLSFADMPDEQRFHVFMIGELAAAELSAANVYEVESMPWDFIADQARQCWDEARHAEINCRWFMQSGRSLDAYAAVNIYYDLYHALSLEGRLAILCIVDEARALDSQRVRADEFVAAGELQKARSTERIMHEEVRHVGYGNRWLEHLAAERGVTKDVLVARGRQELITLIEARCGGAFPRPPPTGKTPPRPLPIAVALQERAGFTPEELEVASRQQQRPLGQASPYVRESDENEKGRASEKGGGR